MSALLRSFTVEPEPDGAGRRFVRGAHMTVHGAALRMVWRRGVMAAIVVAAAIVTASSTRPAAAR